MNEDFRDLIRALCDAEAQADLAHEGTVFQIGVPPRRIDVLTGITGVAFAEAWPGRLEIADGNLRIPVIGREDLIRNKRALGRPKDLLDVALLEKHGP
jgi:hypothetical protein